MIISVLFTADKCMIYKFITIFVDGRHVSCSHSILKDFNLILFVTTDLQTKYNVM